MSSFQYKARDVINRYNKKVIDDHITANDYKFDPISINDIEDDLSLYTKIKMLERMLFGTYKFCGVSVFSDIYHEVVRIIDYYYVIEYRPINKKKDGVIDIAVKNPYEELLRLNLFIYQLVTKYNIGYDTAHERAVKRLNIKIPKEVFIDKLNEKESIEYNKFVFKIKSNIDPLLV